MEWMDGWVDGWTDGQMDEQVNKLVIHHSGLPVLASVGGTHAVAPSYSHTISLFLLWYSSVSCVLVLLINLSGHTNTADKGLRDRGIGGMLKSTWSQPWGSGGR